eukprot:1819352-Prymnesium_polylepis.1
MLFRLLARYDSLLVARPIATKTATAIAISGVTDVGLQRFLPPPPPTATQSPHAAQPHDFQRTLRQTAWSGAMGPVMHWWFGSVLSRLPALGPLPAPVVGVLFDQATLMPLSHVAYFAYISLATNGGSTERVTSDVHERLWPTLRTGFAVVPGVLLFNLALVPLRYRVLFVNVVLGMGYGGYINWMGNRAMLVQQDDVVEADVVERRTVRGQLVPRLSYASGAQAASA